MSIRVFTPIYEMVLAIRERVDFFLTLESTLWREVQGIPRFFPGLGKLVSTKTAESNSIPSSWSASGKLTTTVTHEVT